jgi:DNA polymerase elongation subunit (family B)
MSTLVFDIETAGGEPWESLDEPTKRDLSRSIEREGDSEKEKERPRLRDELNLSPFTGRVAALGVYDLERGSGAVYYDGEADREEVWESFSLLAVSEREMLAIFWEKAVSYDVFVSWNGRAFDTPFLLHRSLAHGLHPTVGLIGRRYLSQQEPPYHVDLLDELTFYGALRRRASLRLVCRAYGIETPPTKISGNEIESLYQNGERLTIARHNASGLLAIAAIYERWRTHLAPPNFINTIEF